MTSTSDSLWLELWASTGALILEEYYQSYTSFHHFPQPYKETPQLITLIGSKNKMAVLQKISPHVSGSKIDVGEVHLRIDNDTLDDQSPVLYADCSLHVSRLWKKVITSTWHLQRRPLLWTERSQ
jgi:hypothetical protein